MTLFGGFAIPFYRFGVVLCNAYAVFVHKADVVLAPYVPLLGSPAKPLHRFGVVLCNAYAVIVHTT